MRAPGRSRGRRALASTFDDALARRGDEAARAAFRRAGELIGLAVANVVIFLCPDCVVVGGGGAKAGSLLLEPLRASLADRARVAPLERISVVEAELGPHAGAIGAALWGAQVSDTGHVRTKRPA
jgi:glucokinase